MNTLIKHIEYLLTKHDCIIVSGLGGFVASYKEASFEDGIITPPAKVVTFNPSLSYNDGLLASSLMAANNISFNEAMGIVNSSVKECIDMLNDGKVVSLGSLGELKRDSNNSIQFNPSKSNSFDLNLFGFENLAFPKLEKVEEEESGLRSNEKDIVFIPVNVNLLKRISSVAAIIIAMLLISHPLEKGNIPQNYASIVSSHLLMNAIVPSVSQNEVKMLLGDSIIDNNQNENGLSQGLEDITESDGLQNNAFVEGKSIDASNNVGNDIVNENPSNEAVVNDVDNSAMFVNEKPIFKNTLVEESVNKANVVQSVKKEKRYYIIVGSFLTEKQAVDRIKFYDDKGYAGINFLHKDDKYRLYINSFLDKDEANKYLDSLRGESENFKDAWLLASRG